MLAVVALVFVVALIGLLEVRQVIRHGLDARELHTYNGTTWEGDTCYVDTTGVLWCSRTG